MTVFSKNMSQLVDKYKFWVCRNPEKVRFLENYSVLLLSVITGKITKSNIPYEWIALGGKLFTFFNNHVLNAPDLEDISISDRIKIFTTILGFGEICLEKTTECITGQSGRWKLIVFLQFFKFLVKLTVRFYYKERIVCCPYSYLPVDIPKSHTHGISERSSGNASDLNSHFVLKRSGRVVRKVHSAPPLYCRLWKPPVVDVRNVNSKRLEKILLAGELLFLMKPIVTLGAMKKYGYGTWKPWTISLLMDLASLYLVNYPYLKPNSLISFSPSERQEIGRRRTALLSYLLKSPFYERHTRDRLKTLLSAIPLLGQVASNQLDFYLETYFFLWSK